jgi:hypothetical protein
VRFPCPSEAVLLSGEDGKRSKIRCAIAKAQLYDGAGRFRPLCFGSAVTGPVIRRIRKDWFPPQQASLLGKTRSTGRARARWPGRFPMAGLTARAVALNMGLYRS